MHDMFLQGKAEEEAGSLKPEEAKLVRTMRLVCIRFGLPTGEGEELAQRVAALEESVAVLHTASTAGEAKLLTGVETGSPAAGQPGPA